MRLKARIGAPTLGLAIAMLSVVTAGAASIVITPTTVPAGGMVSLSGNVIA